MDTATAKETTKEEKLYQLFTEWIDAKRLKKEAVKTHNEEIKRIEEEMEELAEDDVQTEKTNG